MSAAVALELAAAHPHDFTLQYPPRREYFRERFRAPVTASLADAREVLLYVHVPFCARRCAYCNFAIDVDPDRARMERYVQALERTLEATAAALRDDATILGVDVGGGTPTRLPPELLSRVLAALRPFLARASVARPLSVETTPEIAASAPEVLDALRAGAVDRVSVGLQSGDPLILDAVGRPPPNLHARAIHALRAAGFARVNVDLIFALPCQDVASWLRDVDAAIALGPDSITTYDCLYRGKGRALTRRTLTLPAPSTYGALYDASYARLRAAGFHAQYGSVNFSRRAGETGTSAYFEARLRDAKPYVGVGTYATSHVGDVWTFERAGVDAWTRAALSGEPTVGDAYQLPRSETMTKALLLALSFGRVDRAPFAARFGESIERRFGARLAVARARGWLREDEAGWALAEGAFHALPFVRALLHTDEALGWLAGLRPGRVSPRA